MKPPRPRALPSSQRTTRLVDVFPAISQALRLDEKAKEWSLMSVCDRLLNTEWDGRFEGQARAAQIQWRGERRQMIVELASPLAASELGFYQQDLVGKLNQFSRETGITIDEIQLRVRR